MVVSRGVFEDFVRGCGGRARRWAWCAFGSGWVVVAGWWWKRRAGRSGLPTGLGSFSATRFQAFHGGSRLRCRNGVEAALSLRPWAGCEGWAGRFEKWLPVSRGFSFAAAVGGREGGLGVVRCRRGWLVGERARWSSHHGWFVGRARWSCRCGGIVERSHRRGLVEAGRQVAGAARRQLGLGASTVDGGSGAGAVSRRRAVGSGVAARWRQRRAVETRAASCRGTLAGSSATRPPQAVHSGLRPR